MRFRNKNGTNRPEVVFCGNWLSSRQCGVHRYAYSIVAQMDKLLAEIPEKNRLRIALLIPRDIEDLDIDFQNIRIVRYGFAAHGFVNKIISRFWRQIAYPVYIHRTHALGVDLALSLPLFDTGICAIHDCICEIFYRNGAHGQTRYQWKVRRIARQGRLHIVTPSDWSKKDLMRIHHIPEEKITVIGNGWEHMQKIEADNGIFSKFNIPEDGKYCFALGSKYAHKNLEWIFRTAQKNPTYIFVISGLTFHKEYDRLENLPENVISTGYISDGEVKALMQHCTAFLQPSLYEGFGIPPLEALSVGAPAVIVSNASCLPEIYEDCVYYINPYSDGCIIDDVLHSTKVSPPNKVLEKHTWKRAASEMYALCERMVRK